MPAGRGRVNPGGGAARPCGMIAAPMAPPSPAASSRSRLLRLGLFVLGVAGLGAAVLRGDDPGEPPPSGGAPTIPATIRPAASAAAPPAVPSGAAAEPAPLEQEAEAAEALRVRARPCFDEDWDRSDGVHVPATLRIEGDAGAAPAVMLTAEDELDPRFRACLQEAAAAAVLLLPRDGEARAWRLDLSADGVTASR
jgi:hypothetical protein